MATAFAPPTSIARPRRYPISADQYETMIEAGVLAGARVELIGGEIIEMAAQYMPHTRAKMTMLFRLKSAIDTAGLPLELGCEGSVRVSPYDVPEPDVFIYERVPGDRTFPASCLRLAVEICESTHAVDLGLKPQLYAAAAIPEYWIVDLRARTITALWSPADGAYQQTRTVAFGAALASATLPITVATDSLGD